MAKGGPDEKVASSASPSSSRYDPTLVRNVQQALNDKGYNAGAVDGQWGPSTQDALTRFQQAAGVAQTGAPDGPTLTALGVSR
jgi:peptidoglycan hydrolase-like protein with peptidoglycan-binding domain